MSELCDICLCIKPYTFKDVSEVVDDGNSSKSRRNWDRWLNERKKVFTNLSKLLKRTPEELLMNYAEKYRKIKEELIDIEYAQINTNFEKYRGNPEFWTLPFALTEKCKEYNPVYFSIKTKPQRNEVPPIDVIGIPEEIMKEKQLILRTRNIWTVWQKSEYRAQRLKKLHKKIKNIKPHNPLIEFLFVKGRSERHDKLTQTDEELCSKHVPSKLNSILSRQFTVHQIPRVALQINSVLFSSNTPLETPKSILIKFIPLNKCDGMPPMELDYLEIENKGVTTVRIDWLPFKRNMDLAEYLPPEPAPAFHFNSNRLIIVPGEKVKLPIWFLKKKPGAFFEYWEISTLPQLWETGQVNLSLIGIIYRQDFDAKSIHLKSLIDNQVRADIIENWLNEVLYRVTIEPGVKKAYDITEKELFETSNYEYWGTKKRKKYAYNKDVVEDLKEFYKQVRQDENPPQWNYSMEELGIIAKKKDVVDYAEYQANVTLLTHVMSENPPHIYGLNYNKFMDLKSKLEPELMIPNNERSKYWAAFIVLKTHLTRMCTGLETCYKPKKYYPSCNIDKIKDINDMPERLIFERFDDVWLERLKRGWWNDAQDIGAPKEPRSIRMKNIPSREVEENQRPDLKSNTSGTKPSQIKVKRSSVNVYRSRQSSYQPKTSSYRISREGNSAVKIKNIRTDPYEMYVFVYTSLCNAVDDMVAAIETMKETSLSFDDIYGLRECEVITQIQPTLDVEDTEDGSSVEEESETDAFKDYLNKLNENENIRKYFFENQLLTHMSQTSNKEYRQRLTIPSQENYEENTVQFHEVGVQTSIDNFLSSISFANSSQSTTSDLLENTENVKDEFYYVDNYVGETKQHPSLKN